MINLEKVEEKILEAVKYNCHLYPNCITCPIDVLDPDEREPMNCSGVWKAADFIKRNWI